MNATLSDHSAPDRIEHILRENPFFEEFSAAEMNCFARQASLRSCPAGTVLFRKGDIGSYLFFVVEGEVEVRLESASLKQVIIATFGSGSCIGEMAILDDYPRSATIMVTKPAELLLFSRDRFEAICTQQPALGIKFLKGIARNLSLRLRQTNGRFADLA